MSHPTEFAPFATCGHPQTDTHKPCKHPQPAKPAAALAELKQTLAQLQTWLADPDLASLHQPTAQLTQLCWDIEHAVVETICHLAYSQLGMQALLDLLTCLGDDVRLPSSRLKELLEPLDKRMGESLTLLTRVL